MSTINDNHDSNTASSGAGPSNTSAYTVLRIKRKATEAPLSSLVIQHLEPRLTAKRRRDVSGRPRGVFRLAETVPETWQGRGEEGEVLKSRIQNLLSTSQPNSPIPDAKTPTSPIRSPLTAPTPSIGPPLSTSSALPPSIKEVAQPDAVDPVITASRKAETPVKSPPPSASSARPSQTQFRVVPPLSPRTRSMLPPRLLTTAETEGKGSPLVFVDAQAVATSSSTSFGKPVNPQEEKEMAAFLPMLEEYLKLEETQKTAKSVLASNSLEDEWVYDLYYRDNRGSAPLGLGVGDGVTIGELLGFEDISPPSSISGSEPEDEADEDSNDEDYYRNDYPEDEDADEDMEGFRVAGGQEDDWSDEDEYEDSDADERGEWGYR